jgi:hypothetical protein
MAAKDCWTAVGAVSLAWVNRNFLEAQMAARTGAGEWRQVPISADTGYSDPLKTSSLAVNYPCR